MKINKWTLGLAAVGLVTLAPGVRADDVKPTATPVVTALSATTISGYVDTSAVWSPGTGNANVAPYAFNGGKHDGFNVDSAVFEISRAPDEGQWGAGYTAEFQYGPDTIATGLGAVRQAFVELRVPVGNGIDFQIGQWDNLLGYESNDSYKNPNWTRSYAYTIEPNSHTGILATYKINDSFSAQFGVVDSLTGNTPAAPNVRVGAESKKGFVSLLSFTAPDSWGSLKGSGLYAGFDWGASSTTFGPAGAVNSKDREHLYLGATLNTPVKDLTLGAAYDAVWHTDVAGTQQGFFGAIAAYSSYKLTDKATLNLRGEWAHGNALGALSGTIFPPPAFTPVAAESFNNVLAITGTLQYDLWANVISRLEVRWDHIAGGNGATGDFGGTVAGAGTERNEVLVAANVIYKF